MANAAGMMAKYFDTSLAMLNVVSAPRVIRSCLPISTISISLVGFEVEIDQISGFLGRLRAGIHGHGDIGLSQRRGVIRAIAGHRHQPPACLSLADQFELHFGRGLRQKIINSRFRRNRRCRQADCRL